MLRGKAEFEPEESLLPISMYPDVQAELTRSGTYDAYRMMLGGQYL